MENTPTIVLVLRSGGDFAFRDAELIARHINGKWSSKVRPRIICFYDKAKTEYQLDGLEIKPLTNDWPTWWSRMFIYGPDMEQYRPFLYLDLDTAVISSVEFLFDIAKRYSDKYITLEDFYQAGRLATGIAWIPAQSSKVTAVWNAWVKNGPGASRMDYFLRTVVQQDLFWQQLTDRIYDFKPKSTGILRTLPPNAGLVCFHGKPRIYQCVEASMTLDWVTDYVEQETFVPAGTTKEVSVIIPYRVDRGWLKEAVCSVPEDAQLILSPGEANWPTNFNRALSMATGKYIRYLHEDDMLTPNCIADSLRTFEHTGADFIHGDAIELYQATGRKTIWKSPKKDVTLQSLLQRNTLHSVTLMYRREIFEQLGGFDESLEYCEEYEFNLRCLQAGFQVAYCDSPLGIYRRHPQQKIRSGSHDEHVREKALVNSKYL